MSKELDSFWNFLIMCLIFVVCIFVVVHFDLSGASGEVGEK